MTQSGIQRDLQEVILDGSTPPPLPNRSGLVSWDPELQFEPGLGTDNLIKSGNLQSSHASHSSVVNDHGDARRLTENRASSTTRSSNGYGDSTVDLVAHLGAVFDRPRDVPQLKDYNLVVHEGKAPPSQVAAGSLISQSAEEDKMEASIRATLIPSAIREGKEFVPNDDLERIVTKHRVRQELANVLQGIPIDELDHLTEQIWEVKPAVVSESPSKMTTRRRIFAILALMQKVDQIKDFIREDLYDSDMPFVLSEGPRKGVRHMYWKDEGGNLHSVQAFAQWQPFEIDSFDNYQWELLAPYFHLCTKSDPKILHYNLENRTILPFIEDEEVKHAGGYGDVWRVKIHPAHHNHCPDSVRIMPVLSQESELTDKWTNSTHNLGFPRRKPILCCQEAPTTSQQRSGF